MITAAGNIGNFKEALTAYINATTAGVANEVTHASTITAVGNNQSIDLNKKDYEEDRKMNQQHNFSGQNPNSLFSSTSAPPSRNTGINEPGFNDYKRPQQ